MQRPGRSQHSKRSPVGRERPRATSARSQFVLFAEDRGIIGSLTDYVIERAATEWPLIRHLDATLSINVSMRNFEEPSFAKRTLAKLEKHGIPPRCITIELTETSRMIDRKNAVATARKLEIAGVSLSIDDFGEGYAALSYLKTFRAKALKIDRRYVTTLRKTNTIIRSCARSSSSHTASTWKSWPKASKPRGLDRHQVARMRSSPGLCVRATDVRRATSDTLLLAIPSEIERSNDFCARRADRRMYGIARSDNVLRQRAHLSPSAD